MCKFSKIYKKENFAFYDRTIIVVLLGSIKHWTMKMYSNVLNTWNTNKI